MSELQYTEKFIAFLDVLGWQSLVRASDKGRGLSLGELCEILDELGKPADREHFEKYGPTTCPQAPRIRKDIDFCITRFSDSALISAEVSSAGLINLVSYCSRACTGLLSKGVMCRGCIKRGRIYHTSEYQIGAVLNDVVEWEKKHVSIFKKDADEHGTPFIEIDMDVVQYVSNQPDKCVKEMFPRFVEMDRDLTAIFPFKRLDPSIFFGPRLGQRFNPERARESVNVVRGWIQRMKEHVQHHVDWSNESACQKGNQYIRMLDAKLVACDQMDDAINLSAQPFPSGQFTPEDFPGLF